MDEGNNFTRRFTVISCNNNIIKFKDHDDPIVRNDGGTTSCIGRKGGKFIKGFGMDQSKCTLEEYSIADFHDPESWSAIREKDG